MNSKRPDQPRPVKRHNTRANARRQAVQEAQASTEPDENMDSDMETTATAPSLTSDATHGSRTGLDENEPLEHVPTKVTNPRLNPLSQPEGHTDVEEIVVQSSATASLADGPAGYASTPTARNPPSTNPRVIRRPAYRRHAEQSSTPANHSHDQQVALATWLYDKDFPPLDRPTSQENVDQTHLVTDESDLDNREVLRALGIEPYPSLQSTTPYNVALDSAGERMVQGMRTIGQRLREDLNEVTAIRKSIQHQQTAPIGREDPLRHPDQNTADQPIEPHGPASLAAVAETPVQQLYTQREIQDRYDEMVIRQRFPQGDHPTGPPPPSFSVAIVTESDDATLARAIQENRRARARDNRFALPPPRSTGSPTLTQLQLDNDPRDDARTPPRHKDWTCPYCGQTEDFCDGTLCKIAFIAPTDRNWRSESPGPARQRIQWEQTPYHRATNRPITGPEQIPPLRRQDAFQQATQVIDLQSDHAPKEQTPVLAAVYATSATDDAMHQVYPPLTSDDTIPIGNNFPITASNQQGNVQTEHPAGIRTTDTTTTRLPRSTDTKTQTAQDTRLTHGSAQPRTSQVSQPQPQIQQTTNVGTTVQSTMQTTSAIVTTTSATPTRTRAVDQRTIRCNYCGQLGHGLIRCPARLFLLTQPKPTVKASPRPQTTAPVTTAPSAPPPAAPIIPPYRLTSTAVGQPPSTHLPGPGSTYYPKYPQPMSMMPPPIPASIAYPTQTTTISTGSTTGPPGLGNPGITGGTGGGTNTVTTGGHLPYTASNLHAGLLPQGNYLMPPNWATGTPFQVSTPPVQSQVQPNIPFPYYGIPLHPGQVPYPYFDPFAQQPRILVHPTPDDDNAPIGNASHDTGSQRTDQPPDGTSTTDNQSSQSDSARHSDGAGRHSRRRRSSGRDSSADTATGDHSSQRTTGFNQTGHLYGNEAATHADLPLPKSVLRSMTLPTFGGLPTDPPFLRWKKTFEEYCSLNSIDERLWKNVLRVALHTHAKTWIDIQDKENLWTYEVTVKRLQEEFDQHSNVLQAAAALSEMPQGEKESVHAFFRRITENADRLCEGSSEEAIRQRNLHVVGSAIRGIRPELRDAAPNAVYAKNPEEMKYHYHAVELNQRNLDRPPRRLGPSRTQPNRGILRLPRSGRDQLTWSPNVSTVEIPDDETDPTEDPVHLGEVDLDQVQKAVRAENKDLLNVIQQTIQEALTKNNTPRYQNRTGYSRPYQARDNSHLTSKMHLSCYYCGKEGHIWPDCKVRHKRHGPGPVSVANGSTLPPYDLPYAPVTVRKVIQANVDQPRAPTPVNVHALQLAQPLSDDEYDDNDTPEYNALELLADYEPLNQMDYLEDDEIPKTAYQHYLELQQKTPEDTSTQEGKTVSDLGRLLLHLLVTMIYHVGTFLQSGLVLLGTIMIVLLLLSGTVDANREVRAAAITPAQRFQDLFTETTTNYAKEVMDKWKVAKHNFTNIMEESMTDFADQHLKTIEKFSNKQYRDRIWINGTYHWADADPTDTPFDPKDPLKKFKPGPFTNIMENAKAALGAVANLALGAAAVPEGLAIISSDHVYIPMLLEMAPPQWMPIELRHPKVHRACSYAATTKSYRKCLRIIATGYAHTDCPMSTRLEDEYRSIVTTFRKRYEGSVNHQFYATMMQEFCVNNKPLCTTRTDTAESIQPKREKRQVLAFGLLGTLAMGGLMGLGKSISNGKEIERLDRSVAQLKFRMAEADRSLRALHFGLQVLRDRDTQIMDYTAKGFRRVYETVEQLRCSFKNQLTQLSWWMGFHVFRQYLDTQLEAVMRASTTGRLTPTILGAEDLRRILHQTPALKNSVAHRELSYVYQHATVFPVSLDFHGLKFGYILQIPNPKEGDIYPLYRIYNTGFHRPTTTPHELHHEVYVAPLAPYAVLTKHQGLTTLDITNCDVAPAVMSCGIGAIARSKVKEPCLALLTAEDCTECELVSECMQEVTTARLEGRSSRVITTPAGSLIRAYKDRVRKYTMPPHLSPGNPGELLPKSEHGTYWLAHSDYSSFSVGTAQYPTQGQNVFVTKVLQPQPFNFSLLPEHVTREHTLPLAVIAQQAKQIHEVAENIEELKKEYLRDAIVSSPRPLDLDDLDIVVKTTEWEVGQLITFIALAILVALTAALLFYCVIVRWRRHRQQIWSQIEAHKDDIHMVAQRQDEVRTQDTHAYRNWDFNGFVGWLRDNEFMQRLLRGNQPRGRRAPPQSRPNLEDWEMQPPLQPEAAQPMLDPRKQQQTAETRVHINHISLQEMGMSKYLEFTHYPEIEDVWINALETGRADPKAVNQAVGFIGLFGGMKCTSIVSLIDTGSDISLCTKSMAMLTQCFTPVQQSITASTPTEGHNLKILGSVEIGLYLHGLVYGHRLPVIPDSKHRRWDVLIGNDLLSKIGEVRVNYFNKTISPTRRHPECNHQISLDAQQWTIHTISIRWRITWTTMARWDRNDLPTVAQALLQ
jgi:hypothetical protein